MSQQLTFVSSDATWRRIKQLKHAMPDATVSDIVNDAIRSFTEQYFEKISSPVGQRGLLGSRVHDPA
jgi:hypothetical protein